MDQDLKIGSPAFAEVDSIPAKYTSDGADINPPLNISGVGSAVQALALVVDDPDAATDPDGPGKTFDHWILFNIPPQTVEIGENSSPPGSTTGLNGAAKNSYIGPAPPNGRHRYFFKLYALSEPLKLDARATKSDLESAMQGKIMAQAQLMGTYQKQR